VGSNWVSTLTTGPGSGFTQRIITGYDGNILEDQVVTTTGAYAATAPVSPSGAWIMQLAAFRAASSGGDTTPPSAPSGLTATAASGSQINLSWTASTDNVGVTGYLVKARAATPSRKSRRRQARRTATPGSVPRRATPTECVRQMLLATGVAIPVLQVQPPGPSASLTFKALRRIRTLQT
jgi:hypothetical protein